MMDATVASMRMRNAASGARTQVQTQRQARTQVQAQAQAKAVPAASYAQMPLSLMKGGETAVVAKVRGRGELHHHLETLGFVEGAQVTVVSEAAGDLIVEVKGTQVALNRQVAARIIASVAS